jgi:hypothetical protein
MAREFIKDFENVFWYRVSGLFWSAELLRRRARESSLPPICLVRRAIFSAPAYFKQQGFGNQLRSSSRAAQLQAWDLAFENGYTDGFKKTHRAP